MKLELDASCNENGPGLSLDPTQCLLVPIIVKCNKFVTVEAQTLIDVGTSTCFMDKEFVQQYKSVLVEKNTPLSVEVIDGWNLSSRPITHETKPLYVTIGSHISKVVFNVISSPRSLVIIGLSWLDLHNPKVDWHIRSFHFETP
jgi:hypothetical protein